jgi:N-acetylmuramate 1-kinase
VPNPVAVDADPRLQLLTEWLQRTLRYDFTIAVASADASFRRYFRVTPRSSDAPIAGTLIAMDAPPAKENLAPYLQVANLLVAAGVNAPKVLERELEQGFLLISDLGSRTYLAELNESQTDAARADALYSDALDALLQMQRIAIGSGFPSYDSASLQREMQLFIDWYLGKHLGRTLSPAAQSALQAAFAELIRSALAQPQVFVHRDYHSRNLMAVRTDPGSSLGNRNPGVLDFQDAVVGPVTYDLVSLLRDCYVAWPLARVHGWALAYRERAHAAGIDVGSDPQLFLRWFDLMGVQRHLKAVGIFARLWHRDGKSGYLGDVPRTLAYIRQVLPQYPELEPLARIVNDLPA